MGFETSYDESKYSLFSVSLLTIAVEIKETIVKLRIEGKNRTVSERDVTTCDNTERIDIDLQVIPSQLIQRERRCCFKTCNRSRSTSRCSIAVVTSFCEREFNIRIPSKTN